MAFALREGKLGVMDYYDMQNIKADTKMREKISESSRATISDKDKKGSEE
jgi:uncharacterized protein YqfA (UPF0365 family)